MPAPSPVPPHQPRSDYFPGRLLVRAWPVAGPIAGDQPRARASGPRASWLACRSGCGLLLVASGRPRRPACRSRRTPTTPTPVPPAVPSPTHWFGTDELGRDILLPRHLGRPGVAHGRRRPIIFGLILGGVIGLVAGFFRGRSERFLMAAMDVMLAFPALLLALAIIAFSPARRNGVISLGNRHVVLTVWPSPRSPAWCEPARWCTASVSSCRVPDPRCRARPHHRREILPNVLPPVLSFAIIGVAVARGRRGRPGLPRPLGRTAHGHLGRLINEGSQRRSTTRRYLR